MLREECLIVQTNPLWVSVLEVGVSQAGALLILLRLAFGSALGDADI